MRTGLHHPARPTRAKRSVSDLVRLLPLTLALAWAIAASPVAALGQAVPLDVMTFNIRYGNANDGENSWQFRRAFLAEVIESHAPHVLGVQEALRSQLDDIHRAVGGYAEVGVGRDDGQEAGEYSAILYDSTRLELLDQGTFWLSATPEVPGSKTWGNNITRIVSWAHFNDRESGRTFYMFNTHFDHQSQPSRDSSAVLLLRRLSERDPADPVIVTGDFNAGESNSAFRRLLSGDAEVPGAPQLRDTFRVIHPEETVVGTFNGWSGNTNGDKIDAILVSDGWEVLDATIDRVSRDGRYPSDHYPVTARIVLTGGGPQ
ncbi:MAG TPA: endonuclease/exonuclease/phosphatase family protein [Longimicrobiales bacterium]|nr:endonuclease/exonuclease/phosphatase family protein [Longimicrobiales bacterium]